MTRCSSFACLTLFASLGAGCNSLLGNEDPTLISDAEANDCPGCAELSVPFTGYETTQSFEIYLSSPVNLSGARVTARVRKVSAYAGGMQLFAKNGAPNYAAIASPWWDFTDLPNSWQTLTLSVGGNGTPEPGFDASQVVILQIMLGSGQKTDGDLLNPSVVQIDHVTIEGASAPAWGFDGNASALVVLTSSAMIANNTAVAGSRVTWVGPTSP